MHPSSNRAQKWWRGINMRIGKGAPAARRQAIVDGIRQAWEGGIGVPVEAVSNLVADHEAMRQQAGYHARDQDPIASNLEDNAATAREAVLTWMLKAITLTDRSAAGNLPWPSRRG